MANEKLSIEVTAETKKAQQGFKDLSKAIQTVGDDMDDGRTDAEKYAAALVEANDRVIAEIKHTQDAAEALGRALGPELSAKIGQGGLVQVVSDAKDAGVSFDNAKADAEELAAAIKQIDDSSGSIKNVAPHFDEVGAAAHRVGNETEKSRSVLANFAGNAAQDLPGVSGSFGALNVAVGQFAEYATEGGIAMSGLLSALGPIAIGTVAVSLIAKAFADVKKRAEEARKRTEEWTKALEEAGGVQLDAIGSQIRKLITDNEKFSKSVADLNDQFGFTADDLADSLDGKVSPALERTAAFARDYKQAVADVDDLTGPDEQEAVWRKLGDAYGFTADEVKQLGPEAVGLTKTMEQQGVALDSATQQAKNQKDALGQLGAQTNDVANAAEVMASKQELAASKAESLGAALQAQNDKIQANIDKLHEDADALKAQGDAAIGTADAHRAATAANDAFTESLAASFGAGIAVTEARKAQTEAQKEYNTAVKEHGKSSDEAKAADEKVKTAADGVNEALGHLNESYDAQYDAAVSAAQANQEWVLRATKTKTGSEDAVAGLVAMNGSLIDQASKAAPAAQAKILGYIADVNQIPAKKASEIQALIAQGKLEEAKRLLNGASATRTAYVQAEATNVAATSAELDAIARKHRVANIQAGVIVGGRGNGNAQATGGFASGRTLVGELGPELLDLPPGSHVHSNAETRRIAAKESGGGSPTVINQTINYPAGADPARYRNEQRRLQRRNGSS